MQQSESTLQISPIGYRSGRCGYCKNRTGSFCYYASAKSMSAEVYETLLGRGWRRSGTLLYKPNVKAQCCSHYTIRLDAPSFKPSKAQRQAVNRFNHYVQGEELLRAAARYYPRSRQDAAKRNTEFSLTERIHESELSHQPGRGGQPESAATGKPHVGGPPSEPPTKGKKPPQLEPAHTFTVTLESDTFTEEKYALFENYQRLVHKEPPSRISRDGFKRFLCSSPLQCTASRVHGRTRRLGSHHQCYWLDGQLVAMAVLDLLPDAISAVYFMYHEVVHPWEMGKLGALREIALAIEDGVRWYMMGYYIHSCVKMKYKGDYRPQYILDPETYDWDIFDDDFKSLLNHQKYVSMSVERKAARGGPVTLPAADADAAHSTDALAPDIIQPESAVNMDSSSGDDDDDDDLSMDEIPLWFRDMPGVMTRNQLLTEVDLDHIPLRVGVDVGETQDLVSWHRSSMDSPHSIKCLIAELIAAIGPKLAKDVCIVFN